MICSKAFSLSPVLNATVMSEDAGVVPPSKLTGVLLLAVYAAIAAASAIKGKLSLVEDL